MPVVSDLKASFRVLETRVNDTGTSKMPHIVELVRAFASGTANSTFDVVYSDSGTVASGTPVTYDLLGSLTSILTGAAISFADLCGIILINESTTSGEIITLGAGSNPAFAGLFAATGDAIKAGPSGCVVWFSPIDACIPAAGTADILTLTSASGTISYKILLLGRSA